MILISNLTLSIKDGSTIASTSVYGADKKTYINIGSGNVFGLSWEATLVNDVIDYYVLVIKRYDPTLNVYYDIFDKNIGLVNEFYVDSSLLPVAPEQYMLSIYLVAYGKSGSVTTSNVVNPYICKGSGTYVKVEDESYAEPIMKRALAFAKVALTDAEGEVLQDIEGKALFARDISLPKGEATLADRDGYTLTDKDGNILVSDATKLLISTNGWCVMQDGRTKDANGNWRANDIRYEVLQVLNEATGKYEVLMDNAGAPIYIY